MPTMRYVSRTPLDFEDSLGRVDRVQMTPATATGDPPFRRELSRARSRLYGYLR